MGESQETKIAVLQMQMKGVEKKVDDGFLDVTNKLNDMMKSINSFQESANVRFATSDEVKEVKKLATSRLYIAVVCSSSFTAFVTALIYYFIIHQLT